jgi:hypothetical protein
MVVILVQAANRRLFFAPPHLPSHIVIFPTVAGFQAQSAVSPQLALAAKTMRSLNQRNRQGGANRPQRQQPCQLYQSGI